MRYSEILALQPQRVLRNSALRTGTPYSTAKIWIVQACASIWAITELLYKHGDAMAKNIISATSWVVIIIRFVQPRRSRGAENTVPSNNNSEKTSVTVRRLIVCENTRSVWLRDRHFGKMRAWLVASHVYSKATTPTPLSCSHGDGVITVLSLTISSFPLILPSR